MSLVRFLVETRIQLSNARFTEIRMLNENPDLNYVTEVILNSEREQEPSLEEVCKCLSSLKCGKAAGNSGIVAEMEAGGQLVAEKLWKFFRRVWDEVEVPKDLDLDNYRGIT